MTGPLWDGTGIDPWLPDRLAAASSVTSAEQRMYSSWWGSFSDWLVSVKRGVLAGPSPDPHAVWAQAPAWAEAMTTFVFAGPVIDTVGQAFTAMFGPDFLFDSRPAVTAYLAEVENRLVRTPDEVFDVIASTVARGAGAGESIPTVAARIEDILTTTGTQNWRGRAVTVARTETIGAFNAGRHDSFAAVAELLDDDEFEHQWLCVAPDTPVVATKISAAARRHYVGPLVRITTRSGRTLALTPKHRVLTGRGWIQAESINKSDYLVQVIGVDPAMTPQVQHVPPVIGEVVDAAMQAEPVKVRAVPVTVDFNNQAVDSEVEVVPANRHLAQRIEAGVPQGCEDLFLTHADGLGVITVLPDGYALPCPLRHGLTEHSRAYTSGPALHDLGSFIGRPQATSGAPVTASNASLIEDTRHRWSGAAVMCCDNGDGCASFVHRDDPGSVKVIAPACLLSETGGGPRLFQRPGSVHASAHGLSKAQRNALPGQDPPDRHRADRQGGGDLRWRLASLVAPDQVIEVNVATWTGHVYDLSTESGWFVADGLVIHNSTIDRRTRLDHAEADLQRVPLSHPFLVGGEELMYPGDRNGSARNVVNCRCTTLLLRPGETTDLSDRGWKAIADGE